MKLTLYVFKYNLGVYMYVLVLYLFVQLLYKLCKSREEKYTKNVGGAVFASARKSDICKNWKISQNI